MNEEKTVFVGRLPIYYTIDPTTTADMAAMDRVEPFIQLIESAVYYPTDHDTTASCQRLVL
jgi:hypothetical protein